MSTPQTVLITGGNAGLGFQTVIALLRSKSHTYEIYLTSRTLSKAEAAVKELRTIVPGTSSKLIPLQLDIESDACIHALLPHLPSTLDILINNAGAQLDPLFHNSQLSEREMWDKTWSVNVSSTQVLTTTLIPSLLRSSQPRLLFITSGTSTLAGTENRDMFVNVLAQDAGVWPKEAKALGVPAYRAAKTGLNMLMIEFYRLLKVDGVKVFGVSPGYLATGLGGKAPEENAKFGAGDPAEGADVVRAVVEGERDGDEGRVVLRGGKVQDW